MQKELRSSHHATVAKLERGSGAAHRSRACTGACVLRQLQRDKKLQALNIPKQAKGGAVPIADLNQT